MPIKERDKLFLYFFIGMVFATIVALVSTGAGIVIGMFLLYALDHDDKEAKRNGTNTNRAKQRT